MASQQGMPEHGRAWSSMVEHGRALPGRPGAMEHMSHRAMEHMSHRAMESHVRCEATPHVDWIVGLQRLSPREPHI